jgi:hypothetical protein
MKLDDRERSADEWLAIALKHYGAGEPRSGLEERVLATLRFERERISAQRWDLWPVLAGLAVVVFLGAAIFLGREHRIAPAGVAARHMFPAANKTAAKTATSFVLARKPLRPGAFSRSTARVSDNPHLSQFPSPQPLSEQEEILARYVRENTQEAMLVAQARAELLKKDWLEFENPSNSAKTSE